MTLFEQINQTIKPMVAKMVKPVWEIRINGRLYRTTSFESAYTFAKMFDGHMIARGKSSLDIGIQWII